MVKVTAAVGMVGAVTLAVVALDTVVVGTQAAAGMLVEVTLEESVQDILAVFLGRVFRTRR